MTKGIVILRQPTAALEENKSNLTSTSGEVSASSNQRSFATPNPHLSIKKKRNPPGNPDPDAEVIALSPKTLLATNRFVCEICNKGFQRDQNLQLHRRGHNLPWKLRQRNSKEVRKKVYICPEVTCVHHDPSRALGDLTGIKKHFSRKHGEKKWKCDKCSKKYAVQSDWKAHSKTCGTREYRCDCGTLFSRRDSFITHRAFCDVLAEESTRVCTAANPLPDCHHPLLSPATIPHDPTSSSRGNPQTQFPFSAIAIDSQALEDFSLKRKQQHQLSLRPEVPSWQAYQAPPAQGSFINFDFLPSLFPTSSPLPPRTFHPSLHMSATALLQKAAQMGSTISSRSDRSQMAAHTGGGDSTAVFGLSSSSHINMEGFRPGSQPPSSVQHMVMSSFPSSSHQEGYSLTHGNGWVIGSRGDVDDGGGGGGASSSAAAAADGMTRDFLGLRALSHGNILSMAARLGPCVSSSSYEPLQHCKKPWTG